MPLLPEGPTALSLAGEPFAVREWRIRDILHMETLLAACLPDPLDGLPDASGDPAARRSSLLAAYAKARDWPPRFCSTAWTEALGTPRGAAVFLWMALSRDNAAMTADEIPALLAAMTAAEWAALNSVLWAVSPAAQITRELEKSRGDGNDTAPATPADWESDFDFLARHYHLTYEQIGNLTFSQYGNYIRGGKKERHSLSDAEFAAVLENDEAKDRKRAAAQAWAKGREAAEAAGTLDSYPDWDPWAGRTIPRTTADISPEPATSTVAASDSASPLPAPTSPLADADVAQFAAERGLTTHDVREAAAYFEGVRANWAPGADTPQPAPPEHFGTSQVDLSGHARQKLRQIHGVVLPTSPPSTLPPLAP